MVGPGESCTSLPRESAGPEREISIERTLASWRAREPSNRSSSFSKATSNWADKSRQASEREKADEEGEFRADLRGQLAWLVCSVGGWIGCQFGRVEARIVDFRLSRNSTHIAQSGSESKFFLSFSESKDHSASNWRGAASKSFRTSSPLQLQSMTFIESTIRDDRVMKLDQP